MVSSDEVNTYFIPNPIFGRVLAGGELTIEWIEILLLQAK